MTAPIIIAGTDTGVGKTVFAAALAGVLGAAYWKPVQAGLDAETDSEAVRRLAGPALGQILPEAYRLRLPASPHLAAEREGLEIDSQRLALTPASEAAGGGNGRRPHGAVEPESPQSRSTGGLAGIRLSCAPGRRSAPSTTACCRSPRYDRPSAQS